MSGTHNSIFARADIARSDGLVGYGASLTFTVSSLEVPSSILGSIISFFFLLPPIWDHIFAGDLRCIITLVKLFTVSCTVAAVPPTRDC